MYCVQQTKEDGSMVIEIHIDPDERSILKHDLLGDEGILDWFASGPSAEKIHRCRERMEKQWIPKLMEQGTDIPADDTERLRMIIRHPDYKDREGRESQE